MKQIKFLDYKIDDTKLILYLGDKSQVVVWTIHLNKPLRVEFYWMVPFEVREGIKKFIVDERY